MSGVGSGFPVQDPTQVSVVRRAAQQAAMQLGFGEARAGEVALIVTELGTNLVKHARQGEMLLRVLDDEADGETGIEVLALDRGPGIADVAVSRIDGYSTSGTLGQGLGAIGRLSDFFQVYTQPTGTAIVARIARERRPAVAGKPRLEIGAVRVNAVGEAVCGDEWTARLRNERLVVMIADGLGHGLAAHDAARRAVTEFAAIHEQDPGTIIGDLHAALRSSRGAALAVLAADLERGIARYCGLGNISGLVIMPGGGRQNMVSQNGTAGHSAGRIHEFQYPFPRDAVLVMHSDGLVSHWDLAGYPGLRTRHPSLIAGVLYRDFSRRRDDVTIVVVKERPGV